MLLSDKTIDLLDEGKLTELIEGAEFPREKFLKGGGALVVGFSFVGSVLAGSAKARPARVAAGPPNAALIDSWVAIHADNTATIAFGKIDITGAPTGLLQIAAEELDLTIQQVRAAAWNTDITPNQGTTAGSNSISSGGPQVRQAAAEARAVPARARIEAARRPGLAVDRPRRHRLGQGRSVEEGRLRRAPRREGLLRSEHRQGAAEARHGVQARRPAGEAEGHARQGGRVASVRAPASPARDAARTHRPAAGPGAVRRHRQAALGRRELDQEHQGRPGRSQGRLRRRRRRERAGRDPGRDAAQGEVVRVEDDAGQRQPLEALPRGQAERPLHPQPGLDRQGARGCGQRAGGELLRSPTRRTPRSAPRAASQT